MGATVLVSVMGVLAVVGIYYWWARSAKAEAPAKPE